MKHVVYKHLILPGQVHCAWWPKTFYTHGFCKHSWWLLGASGFASRSLPEAMSCPGHQICLGCRREWLSHCSQWPSRLGHLITLITAPWESSFERWNVLWSEQIKGSASVGRGGKRNPALLVTYWNPWELSHCWKWLHRISEVVRCLKDLF